LPRKWALKHGIKKGEELEVKEEGRRIVIDCNKGYVLRKKELNLKGLDRSAMVYFVRAAYRLGYDQIEVRFDETTTKHLRVNKEVSIISVLHMEVNRLVGAEIIKQTENFCLIGMISEGSIKEFKSILRRIFLLLKDINNDLVIAIKNEDRVLLETIEEKHDSITKFVSYCLRLLNKYGYVDPKNTTVMYHIVASIDKIVDIIKYVSRDVLELKKLKPKKITNEILEFMNSCTLNYIELFYKFEKKKIVDFIQNRDKSRKLIKSSLNHISHEEVKILSNMEDVLEILLDLVESRMSLEGQSNRV
jgi:phosphate uptake regulator